MYYNFVVLQDWQAQEEPHLQEAPQQDVLIIEPEELAIELEVAFEFFPHILFDVQNKWPISNLSAIYTRW